MDCGSSTISTTDGHVFQWHDTGSSLLAAELDGIAKAKKRILLERYIFRASPIGDRYRDALIEAARRGVEVVLVLDYVGSFAVPGTYFSELEAMGGRVIWFNRVRWRFWIFRDHRKLLVIDDAFAVLGGCNIGPEYEGDGVAQGWRDGGIAVTGPVVAHLIESFEAQAARASLRRWSVRHHRRTGWVKAGDDVSLLLMRPGFHQSALKWALESDLRHAHQVAVTMAYFLPVGHMKRLLLRASRLALRFRLLLPGRTDMPAMQVATRALYRQFQRRGAQIFEYQPQVLHAKMMVIDDIVYIGSANLDPRSLAINFEVMLRIRCPVLAQQAVATFERDLAHSELVPRQTWRQPSGWWRQVKERAAHLVFTRLDLGLAQALAHKSEQPGRATATGKHLHVPSHLSAAPENLG
jgi:cardiolipin synthase A/B